MLLVGGWTLAAARQRAPYDAAEQTISRLAATTADDRWLMTAALLAVGVCHVVTAAGLTAAATAGRVILALGGVFTVLTAALPLPGAGAAHVAAAGGAFAALAVWPLWEGPGRGGPGRGGGRVVSYGAAGVLCALVGWAAVAGHTGEQAGLAERAAAAAVASWPFVAALRARSGAPAAGSRTSLGS